MRTSFACVVLGLASTLGAGAAEETFSRSVAAEDYAAAGLSKLSAEEIARLDALVRAYKTGALEAARQAALAAEKARAEAERRAAKAEADERAARAEAAKVAEKKSDEGGFLNRAKVLLRPGTEVEYSTIHSRILGEFGGWQRNTVFTLENGERWQVTSDDSYSVARRADPAITIEPGTLGSFWLRVEGVKRRAKVKLVASGR